MEPKIYILILNYKGWFDTIECLESVFSLNYNNYRVVVCDNNSGDGSIEYLEMWANGKLNLVNTPGQSVGVPHDNFCKKPIKYNKLYNSGKICFDEIYDVNILTFIQNDENNGYAGGNNVGINYILKDKSCKFIWILNNDTVVDSMCLNFLVEKAMTSHNIGICGSTIFYYYDPTTIQMQGGGQFNKYTGSVKNIGCFRKKGNLLTESEVMNRLSYVSGASALVSRAFIETIGLMDESYFLYFEEIDWISRNRGRFVIGYEPMAIVYHKDGSSISPVRDKATVSEFADYCGVRSRFIFYHKFYKHLLPLQYFLLIVVFINRVLRKQANRIPRLMMASLEIWKINK